jgi:beta-xylosidase
MDVTGMKDGDIAGLCLLQKKFGLVGVKASAEGNAIVMIDSQSGKTEGIQSFPLTQKTVYLKAECDFTNKVDTARFFYSLDGKRWQPIGATLKMEYSLAHFMGYRFGLFNYATKSASGYADFDYFHISEKISN